MRDGIVVAVGDDAEVREHTGAATELVDGRGIALVPGLVDSHIHPFHGTDGTRGADLSGLRTLDEVRGALAAERARCAPGEWLLGWGLSYDAFHGERDRRRRDRRRDRRRARVPHVLRLPLGAGEPARRSRSRASTGRASSPPARRSCATTRGVPTGELREAPAMELVRARVPERTRAERLDAYAATLRRLNALGLTGGHVMLGRPGLLDDVDELEARGDLTLRCVVPLLLEPDATDERDRGAARAARPRRAALARRRRRSSSSTA